MNSWVVDSHIEGCTPLSSPEEVKAELPVSNETREKVYSARTQIAAVLDKQDPRLMVVCGPCSIHNLDSGIEYASRLSKLSAELSSALLILMRVYFVKPRTRVGWKGFINDPFLDDSFRMDKGLRLARGFLVQVNELGLPVATEAMDSIIPQYLDDLISWNAIGARTAESQLHRELASGLSTPVGFKNATDGSVDVAINAIKATANSHSFVGVDQTGQTSILKTTGNPYAHIVLRGGKVPNYDADSIALCRHKLRSAELPERIMVDCSHGNSGKDFRKQRKVLLSVSEQIRLGNDSIIGLMVESNLEQGAQSFPPKEGDELRFGVSITDSCIGWEETEELLKGLAKTVKKAKAL